MLSRRLAEIILQTSAECLLPRTVIPASNIRRFYNDPEAVDYLSKHLRERQLLIKKRKPEEQEEQEKLRKSRLQTLDFVSHEAPPRHELKWSNLSTWWQWKLKARKIKLQTFDPEKYEKLGYDLGASDFVLREGGKVRFRGQSEWTLPKPGRQQDIPDSYDPKYLVEGLDLSNIVIEYEGLDCISGLLYLKWLSFKDSVTLNDWGVDKISSEYPSLEYLDLSGCKNVTERGLEALYRLPFLKTLVLTNHYNSPAFELTCYMLEDVNPNLKCIINTPERKSDTEGTKL